MANDVIKLRIAELEAPIIKELSIKGDDVLRDICYQYKANLLDAVPANGKLTLAHLKTLPVEMQRLVRGWKFSAMGDLEVKWLDPDKARDLLAKHFGLLKDQLELTGGITVEEVVARALKAKRRES